MPIIPRDLSGSKCSKARGMDTRSKGKPLGQNTDPGAENLEARAQELSTKEFELKEIERSIKEKENRLRAQEDSLRQQFEDMEYSRHKLDRERETFTRNAAIRDNELSARERELEKKWVESSDLTPLDGPSQDPASGTHLLYEAPPHRMHATALPRGNNGDESSTPKVSFREATESVPYFDGYNIPLTQFTRACRRAREIIPPSAERNLTKLLINKLGRRAYYAVEDEPCDTVTELIDLLTGAFGLPKTLDQYRGELSIIYLKPEEHVLDYISRVKDLRTSILDAERRISKKLEPQFVAEIDNLTVRSFYQGLPLAYRLQMGPEVRLRYTDAFAAAKTIAKQQELDKQRYETRPRTEREPRSVAPIGRPLAHSTPQRSDYRPYRDTRYRQSPPPRQETPARTYDARNQETRRINNPREPDNHVKFCRYCKNPGHEIEDCRKRQYNNSRKNDQGNARGPTREQDATPAGKGPQARPLHPIAIEQIDSDPESQC